MKNFIKNNWFKLILTILFVILLYMLDSGINVNIENTVQVEYAKQNDGFLDFDF